MSAEQLRILMFSDAYGGITNTFIRNEVDHFSRYHKLKYLTLENETPETLHDVEVVPWPRRPVWDRVVWRLWLADWACDFRHSGFARALRSAIDRFQPDVIHCQFAYEALRLLQNCDVHALPPVLVHFHGYDASEMLRKRSYVRALRPFLDRPCVWPVVVSHHMQADLAHAGLNMSRARLLRYGIDLDLFRPSQRQAVFGDGHRRVIVQVSSLIAKKGHRETLRALARMLERNPSLRTMFVFRIAGDGPDRQAIQDLAAALGLASNVEMLGPLRPAETVALLDDADVFAHHSIEDMRGHKEGIPNAIMEAMAMELPVLSTRHAGIPELVEHGVHGLLCEERDVETYSRQIEEILTWGRRPENRRRIEQEYDKNKHNAMLERIYREATRGVVTSETVKRPSEGA